jgi:rod shape-determining protein MreD
MNESVNRGNFVILVTFAIAAILSIVPIPDKFSNIRPEWISLVLIYWCMVIPHRIGVFTAWCVGILMDVLYGTLLGQYALTLSILAFLSYRLQNRLRLSPLLQQAMIILLLVALQQVIILWIKGVSGNIPKSVTYWLPSLTSTLIWPVIAIILDKVRRIFGIV